jgi:hypothetical protein
MGWGQPPLGFASIGGVRSIELVAFALRDTECEFAGCLAIGPPLDVVESAGWPHIAVALCRPTTSHQTVPPSRLGLHVAIALIDLRDNSDQQLQPYSSS